MKTELNNIGTWGRLHYDFLYRNQRSVINAMRLKGTLHGYLMGIDKDAEDMFNPRKVPLYSWSVIFFFSRTLPSL